MMKKRIAKYRCNSCRAEWEETLKPDRQGNWMSNRHPNQGTCPACGSLYSAWLNYKNFQR